MSDEPARRLSGAELDALKFAGRRQLARWSNMPQLSPNHHAQRNALKRAVRIIQDDAWPYRGLAANDARELLVAAGYAHPTRFDSLFDVPPHADPAIRFFLMGAVGVSSMTNQRPGASPN